MLRSMTGFGRAKKSFEDIEITCELQSVNKRHLELNIKLPHELIELETVVRKVLQEALFRGHINCWVSVNFLEDRQVPVTVNMSIAKSMKKAIMSVAEELDIKQSPADLLNLILRERGVLEVSHKAIDGSKYIEKLEKVLTTAVKLLIKEKEREGQLLKDEFIERIKEVRKLHNEIIKIAPKSVEHFKEQLKTLVLSAYKDASDNIDKVIREVAQMADKLDISEEISRFVFHLEHFEELVIARKVKAPNGKQLEFVLQELNREINTIGSKAQDVYISTYVIQIKSELEKLREQVQNVE